MMVERIAECLGFEAYLAPFGKQVVEREEQKDYLETRVDVLVHGTRHVVVAIHELVVLHQSTIHHSMKEDYRYCLNDARDQLLPTDSRWLG